MIASLEDVKRIKTWLGTDASQVTGNSIMLQVDDLGFYAGTLDIEPVFSFWIPDREIFAASWGKSGSLVLVTQEENYVVQKTLGVTVKTNIVTPSGTRLLLSLKQHTFLEPTVENAIQVLEQLAGNRQR